MDTYAARRKGLIHLIATEYGGNQTTFADHIGVKPPQVNRWVSGTASETRRITEDSARRIEERCGKPTGWLDAIDLIEELKDLPPAVPVPVPPGDTRTPIRRATFKLSAGVSGYEVEYENGDSEPIYMSNRWFEQKRYKPEKLIALKISGRSMEPKYNEGDLVIVNTESATPKDGVPFAVNYEGEMVIKRMRRDAGQWFISSDNPDKTRYADKLCAEGCYVLGEVIYLQTENAL